MTTEADAVEPIDAQADIEHDLRPSGDAAT